MSKWSTCYEYSAARFPCVGSRNCQHDSPVVLLALCCLHAGSWQGNVLHTATADGIQESGAHSTLQCIACNCLSTCMQPCSLADGMKESSDCCRAACRWPLVVSVNLLYIRSQVWLFATCWALSCIILQLETTQCMFCVYSVDMFQVCILASMQHPAGNELYIKWLTSLPDDCYIESYDSFPLMAHQQLLAPV